MKSLDNENSRLEHLADIFEGFEWCLLMYNCVIILKFKDRENKSSYLSDSK